ncbi:DUF3289 family protein [Cloacibacterium sp. TD35]|uniref:DUF3289 family protein n=1 Tax=Cloacibacterium sp. TD35 TaxID=2976818 RepID=UPI00237EAF94|nr:DUF3289 family protein [Cloacibacterium sp. TD35]WDT68022.1 DUF3289 family protein [Cloacibacterium sp. TD35]
MYSLLSPNVQSLLDELDRKDAKNSIIRIPYKLLAETEIKPGLDLNGKVAEDLKDVSYLKEIQNSQKKFWEKNSVIFKKSDNELFGMMKDLFTDVSMFEMESIGLDMCQKFFNGTKGNYMDKRLIKHVFGSDEFQEYHKKITNSIKAVIYEGTADLKFLNNKPLYIPRMSFDGFINNAMGLGITIHQVYATKIELINYFCDLKRKYWTGTFRYTLYDHFGLDWNDILLHGEDYKPSPNTGNHFKAWYLLQRYRKAKPFIVELKKDIYSDGKF